MSLWLLMIILHATFAVISFISGLAILSPVRARRRAWLLPAFLVSLAGLIVFMAAAMWAHWYDISVMERVIFSGLVVLGVYMLYRGLRARMQLRQPDVPKNYIDHVGFTLISLFNGFIIVALIDLNAPAWLVVAGAILGVVAGNRGVAFARRRYQ